MDGRIDLPENFKPNYSKDYEIGGNKFAVQVQYMGVIVAPTSQVGTQAETWYFALVVNGNIIEGGPWYNNFGRPLTDENVTNNIASFWGRSERIAEAQQLEGSLEFRLNEIVLKCADLMHQYYMAPGEFQDYEIVSKFMNDEEWHVVLSPNYIKGRMIEFFCKAPEKHVDVTVYHEDRSFKTVL